MVSNASAANRNLKFSDLPIGATFTLTEGSIFRRIKVTSTSWITLVEGAFLAEFLPNELGHPVFEAATMIPNKSNEEGHEWCPLNG